MIATNILHDIVQAAQDGTMPWQAVIEVQQSYYPRCVPHGIATPMILDDEPICTQCIASPAILQRLKTLLPR